MSEQTSMSIYLSNEKTKKYLQSILGERTNQFITSLTSLASSSNYLKNCDRNSLLACALYRWMSIKEFVSVFIKGKIITKIIFEIFCKLPSVKLILKLISKFWSFFFAIISFNMSILPSDLIKIILALPEFALIYIFTVVLVAFSTYVWATSTYRPISQYCMLYYFHYRCLC